MRILSSVLIVAGFVFLVWLVGLIFGFQISLWSSLALSIVLTLGLNLAMRAFRSRGGTRRRTGPPRVR